MPSGHRSALDRAGRREGAEPYGLALDLSGRQPERNEGNRGFAPPFPDGSALPSQSRLTPCQLPQGGSRVSSPPEVCRKPSLASPFGGGAPAGGGEGEVPAAPSHGLRGSAGTLPPPLTNAAERGTIEIEKESLPVRRLARFIYYLEKVADSLAGRLLFHAFEQFHHQCNDDSEYHQHNGEQLKITHEVTLPSTRLPTGGYVNRKFRLPGKGQPPENSGFSPWRKCNRSDCKLFSL